MSKALASMLRSGLLPDFESLYQENKTYTIFAPDDDTFRSLPEAARPLSLLLYQIIPLEVEMGLLQSSAMPEHKLETLLEGHPLVVTTGLPDSFTHLPSLNLVTVAQWDVYNDGKLIVHGMVDFFNPDFQTTHYPWFNGPEAHMVSPTAATDNIKGSSSESMFSFAVLLMMVSILFLFF